MPQNKPTLSICIPTYNRSLYLQKCLSAIIEQSKEFPGEIEIVVSDNASMDDTGEIVKGLQEIFPNLKYFRNQENLGYDRNLDNAIRHSIGKYCWFLSDDELPLDKTIHFVIHLLRTYKHVAYFCLDIASNNPRNIVGQEIIELKGGNELLKKHGLVGGLISQNIIRRDMYPQDVSRYYGNHWIHLSVIFETIREAPIVLVNKTLLKGQRDVCTWAEGGKAFLTFSCLKNIIASWKDIGYEKEVIDSMVNDFSKALPITMFSAKLHGLEKSKENLRILQETFSEYGVYYYIALLIYETPSLVFSLLRRILGK